MSLALWIVQALLATLFVFSGVMKLVMPVEEMTRQMPGMPGWFLHVIGVCEMLGGLGLLLPGLFRIRTGLTPLAAAGLVVPLVVGLLLAFVAWGRWRLAPYSRVKITGGTA